MEDFVTYYFLVMEQLKEMSKKKSKKRRDVIYNDKVLYYINCMHNTLKNMENVQEAEFILIREICNKINDKVSFYHYLPPFPNMQYYKEMLLK